MSFLFVDRILKLEPGKETTGLKYVTNRDIYFHHRQDNITLFPCILGEALGQLCSWNVLHTTDYRFRPVGGVVKSIQIFGNVRPGDTVLLESHIETLDSENAMVSFSGQASVADTVLLKVQHSLAPLLPLHEFNSIEQVKKDFVKLSHEGNELPESHHQKITPYALHYDSIISHLPDAEIIAQKTISPAAPYFATHFPNKPVFPLSLLIEYNLNLAQQLVPDSLLQPTHINKIKISNFILPGDCLMTKIKLKEKSPHRYLMSIHNEVNEKKACVAEVEFYAQ